MNTPIFTPATSDQIERARRAYAFDTDDIAIDDNALVSEAEDGDVWVSAWVWLPCSEEQDATD
jgi:hypothetical protein